MSNGHGGIAGMRPPPAGGDLLAPLVIRSSTAAVRVGDYGPALVMNLDSQATVWIGRDGDVTSTRGVPVPAGQSVPWVGGELWAILGADAQSQAAGSATIVVTTYVHDWNNQATIATAVLNAGTLVIDKPTLLAATATLTGIGPFDVSTFASVVISTSPAGVSGSNRVLTLTWADSAGNTLGQDVYRWALATVDTLQVREVLPVRGSSLTIAVSGGGANTQSIILQGSHRPADLLMRTATDRVLVSQTGTIAANSGLNVNLAQRYDGLCQLMVQMFAGAVNPTRQEVTDQVTGAMVFGGGAGPISGINYSFGTFALPRNSVTITIWNDGGALLNYRLQMIARPEA